MRSLRVCVTALMVVLVCVPALALGREDFTRQQLPPDNESGMYDKRDLQSGPGPVDPLPRVPTKPVLIEPGGRIPPQSSTLSGSGGPDLSGVTPLAGGLGGGQVDPVLRAENQMRRVIRRLD